MYSLEPLFQVSIFYLQVVFLFCLRKTLSAICCLSRGMSQLLIQEIYRGFKQNQFFNFLAKTYHPTGFFIANCFLQCSCLSIFWGHALSFKNFAAKIEPSLDLRTLNGAVEIYIFLNISFCCVIF